MRDRQQPDHETAEAVACETAALIQVVTDARGALAKAAELAARRDGAVEAASALAGAAAALKTQGEALDQRIRATDRQSAVAAHSMADMNQSATALNDQLRTLGNDLLRISDRMRWRYWRFGLAVVAASFVFFALGLVLQRETDVVSFGDPDTSGTILSPSTTRRHSLAVLHGRSSTTKSSDAKCTSSPRWT